MKKPRDYVVNIYSTVAFIKDNVKKLTKLEAAEEKISYLGISLEMGCKTLAGMMGVILAAARSSIFLATATVSTLLKEQKLCYCV